MKKPTDKPSVFSFSAPASERSPLLTKNCPGRNPGRQSLSLPYGSQLPLHKGAKMGGCGVSPLLYLPLW